MPYKRKAKSSPSNFNKRYKRGMTYRYGKTLWSQRVISNKVAAMRAVKSMNIKINRLIETKEGSRRIENVQLAHNNTYVWPGEVFTSNTGNADPMGNSDPQRIGDSITVKGLSACFFLEAAIQRTKVYFRVMLLKGPRGASFARADIFKSMTNNKMIDQLNTEKYTILAQRIVNVTPPNTTVNTYTTVTGVPATAVASGITGNKIIKFWIPGRKLFRNSVLQYENGTSTPKFFDYRWVIVSYDWYGTPQDTNNVGVINEAYSKLYFKDA